MLNITYSTTDTQTAEQMQQDLSQATLRLENEMLIALLTPDSVADQTVQSAIKQAQKTKQILVLVLLEPAILPDYLKGERTLDLTKKYDKEKLIAFVNRSDISKERSTNNRRLLWLVGGVVLIMFVISLASISAGVVAFPVDEYSTENAIRDGQVATLVAPQIEILRPRTTEDALNFQSTLDAIDNEDLLPFVIGTATAIPLDRQATVDARETQISGTDTAETQSADE